MFRLSPIAGYALSRTESRLKVDTSPRTGGSGTEGVMQRQLPLRKWSITNISCSAGKGSNERRTILNGNLKLRAGGSGSLTRFHPARVNKDGLVGRSLTGVKLGM